MPARAGSYTLLRRDPDEAGRALGQGAGGLAIAAPRDELPIRAEDEQPRPALGRELEERVDRTGAAHAEPLDRHAERGGERGGRSERRLVLRDTTWS